MLGLPGMYGACKASLGSIPLCLCLQLWKRQEPFTDLRDRGTVVELQVLIQAAGLIGKVAKGNSGSLQQ